MNTSRIPEIRVFSSPSRRLRYIIQGWLLPAAPRPRPIHHTADDPEFRRMSFTFALIALSARVACADGKLTREKYLAFRDSFPLSGGVCDKIRSLFALACENQAPADYYALQIQQAFPRHPELLSSMMNRLFLIASANGKITRTSEQLLSRIAHRLNISSAEYSNISAQYTGPRQAHQILGIHSRSSASLIKQRYRELMRRYHPDRFANIPLSEEMELLLSFKTSEINKAYRQLSKKAA